MHFICIDSSYICRVVIQCSMYDGCTSTFTIEFSIVPDSYIFENRSSEKIRIRSGQTRDVRISELCISENRGASSYIYISCVGDCSISPWGFPEKRSTYGFQIIWIIFEICDCLSIVAGVAFEIFEVRFEVPTIWNSCYWRVRIGSEYSSGYKRESEYSSEDRWYVFVCL